jgi:peptidoglycan/LPS O-acetylase OafA/YrhL
MVEFAGWLWDDARRKSIVSGPRGSPGLDRRAIKAAATEPRPRREPLPALSGLRFFLAGYVLLFHFAPLFFGGSVFARNFVRAGSSAIPCFFLLSGFILTYAHVIDSAHLDQPRRQFRLARFLRIYPAYLLAFLCSAPFALVQSRHFAVTIHTFIDIGLFLLLLQTWVPGLWSYWNYPAWSLSVEAFFYVLFPLMVSLMFRPRWNWRVVLGAVWIAGLIAPVAMLGTTRADWLLSSPPMHLPEFAFGMVLGNRLILHCARPQLLSMPGQTSAMHERAWGWTVPIAAAILIACYGSGWFPKSLIDHGLFAPLIGCVIWGLARGRGWFSYLLGSKPVVYLGEISFGVYIFQFPVFTACFVLATRLRIPWNTRLTFLACCAILVCASCVSFEVIEKPLRRAGMRRYFKGLPVAIPPLATPPMVAAA